MKTTWPDVLIERCLITMCSHKTNKKNTSPRTKVKATISSNQIKKILQPKEFKTNADETKMPETRLTRNRV